MLLNACGIILCGCFCRVGLTCSYKLREGGTMFTWFIFTYRACGPRQVLSKHMLSERIMTWTGAQYLCIGKVLQYGGCPGRERARGETEVKSRSKKQKSCSAWEGWERAVFGWVESLSGEVIRTKIKVGWRKWTLSISNILGIDELRHFILILSHLILPTL